MKPDEHHHPVPIAIPDEIAAGGDGPGPAERLDGAIRVVFSAPKSSVLKDEAKTNDGSLIVKLKMARSKR